MKKVNVFKSNEYKHMEIYGALEVKFRPIT